MREADYNEQVLERLSQLEALLEDLEVEESGLI